MVDIERLSKSENIEILYPNLTDDISSIFLIYENRKVILCNRNLSYMLQRFSIAHSLSHYYLKHQRKGLFIDNLTSQSILFHRGNETSKGETRQEVEANNYAASLLIPTEKLKGEIDKIAKSNPFKNWIAEDYEIEEERIIKNLSGKFQVSNLLMKYRIGHLNLSVV